MQESIGLRRSKTIRGDCEMECAVWVQAIATIILVAVTGYYAWLNKRIMEESNMAFLNIEKTERLEGFTICLCNRGHGTAINVRVHAKLNSLEKVIQESSDHNGVVDGVIDGHEIVEAIGPSVIPVNANSTFQILSRRYNCGTGVVRIFIEYQIITGKRFIFEWVHDSHNEPYYKLIQRLDKLPIE